MQYPRIAQHNTLRNPRIVQRNTLRNPRIAQKKKDAALIIKSAVFT